MEMFYYYLYLSLKTYFDNTKFGPLNYIENHLDQYFAKIARVFLRNGEIVPFMKFRINGTKIIFGTT